MEDLVKVCRKLARRCWSSLGALCWHWQEKSHAEEPHLKCIMHGRFRWGFSSPFLSTYLPRIEHFRAQLDQTLEVFRVLKEGCEAANPRDSSLEH